MNLEQSRAFYRTFRRRFYRKYPYLQGQPFTYDTFLFLKEQFKEQLITLPKHGVQRYDESYSTINAILEVSLYTQLKDWDADMLFYSICMFILIEKQEEQTLFIKLFFNLEEHISDGDRIIISGSYFFEYWMQWQSRYGHSDDYIFYAFFKEKRAAYLQAWWPAPMCLISPCPCVPLLPFDGKIEHSSGFLDGAYQQSGRPPRHEILKRTFDETYNMYLSHNPDIVYWLVEGALPEERIDNINFILHHLAYLPDDFISIYEKEISIDVYRQAKELHKQWTQIFDYNYDFSFFILDKKHTLYDVRQFYTSHTLPQHHDDDFKINNETPLFL